MHGIKIWNLFVHGIKIWNRFDSLFFCGCYTLVQGINLDFGLLCIYVTQISVIDTELVEAAKCHFINHTLKCSLNQIPEMPLEPNGEAAHKRLRQDHLPLLHLPRPYLNTLHVLYQSHDKIMENDGNYGYMMENLHRFITF